MPRPGLSSSPAAGRAWSALRLAVAALIAVAVVYQFCHDLPYTLSASTPHAAHVPTFVANFFSFFTNQSNIIAAAFLAWAGVHGLRRRGPAGVGLASLQVLAVSCMALTGVVYNVLLRPDEDRGAGVAPFVGWTSEIMHVAVPIFLVIDLVVGPRARRVSWAAVLLPIGYAVAYVAYSLVRAPFVTAPSSGRSPWYPYPFLDPRIQGGWDGVFAYVGVMALGFAIVAALTVAAIRARAAESVSGSVR